MAPYFGRSPELPVRRPDRGALVFNVLHNNLRLITVVSWRSKRIYIKTLMTLKEYMRKEWMKRA